MKNNDKTVANKTKTDDLIWNFELEWPNIDFKWDLTELEWPKIDLNWSTDDYCWDTKKNSEDNVRGGKES